MGYEDQVGRLIEPVSDRQWSPEETRRQVSARIRIYHAAGLRPGDRVLILFGNRLEFFAELLAIWSLGGCAIPVDARLTAFEVSRLVETARARFHVIDSQVTSETVEALAGGTILDTQQAGRDASESGLPRSQLQLDADALILFTSGSTGQPKGVVHTHRSLLARWITLRQCLGLHAYRRTLCVLPTHFGHGLICNCLFPWLSGCDLYIAPPFQPALIMRLGKLIDSHRISFMSSVPSVWNLALKTSPAPEAGSLERVHIGSAPLSADNWQQVIDWTGTGEVFNAYGITETGSWVAGTTGGPVVPESGLIGEPWGSVIQVRPAEGEGDRNGSPVLCQPGEAGMVWLHTPALMKGYFERPDLTGAAVRGGWFMTGDIGMLDERGRLFLKGRERDEINKGGMKVFPADIDEVVEQFPSTLDVCAFACPDPFYGENVGMAVVLENPGEPLLGELFEWMKSRLAEHKLPAKWYVVDEIPRTSRGKINREAVARSCESLDPVDLRGILRRVRDRSDEHG